MVDIFTFYIYIYIHSSPTRSRITLEYPANMLEVRHDLTELLRAHDVRECDKVGKKLMLQIMNGAQFTRDSGAIYEELCVNGGKEMAQERGYKYN
jgi:hypothetical protein